MKICNAEADKKEKKAVGKQIAFWLPFLVILQTARIYSRAINKSTLLAVCSRDSLQVLVVCSIDSQGFKYNYLIVISMNPCYDKSTYTEFEERGI